jgi:hypothetical protein
MGWTLYTTKLQDEAVEALEALAACSGSIAASGQYAGQPSWRTMLRRLAEGELVLVDPASGQAFAAAGPEAIEGEVDLLGAAWSDLLRRQVVALE